MLAPLDGSVLAHVDQVGGVLLAADTTPGTHQRLSWSVRTGEGWINPAATKGVKQALVGPAVIETTMAIDGGPVVHRSSVGVSAGTPVAVIEIENRSDYAVAIGLDVVDVEDAPTSMPASISHTDDGLYVDGRLAAIFGTPPRPAPADDAAAADHGDAAEPTVVFALPHTASLQVTVPLLGMELPDGGARSLAIPAPGDINRGWQRHLESAFRITVGDDDIEAALQPLQRAILSVGPGGTETWRWAVALCESGYASELDLNLEVLADEAPAHVIFAVGRWAELGGDLVQAERLLEPIARSAVTLRKSKHQVIVPMGWSVGMLAGAVRAAQAIDQPDVADEIASLTKLTVRRSPLATLPDIRSELAAASRTFSWPDAHDADRAAQLVRAIRHLVVDESGTTVDLLAELPVAWRGRPLEAHNVVVAAGVLSYGLRWHGARPALLWELQRTSEAPFEVRVPSIDPEWSSLDEAGEELLADPGWPTKSSE